jgi:hypothetical protein
MINMLYRSQTVANVSLPLLLLVAASYWSCAIGLANETGAADSVAEAPRWNILSIFTDDCSHRFFSVGVSPARALQVHPHFSEGRNRGAV